MWNTEVYLYNQIDTNTTLHGDIYWRIISGMKISTTALEVNKWLGSVYDHWGIYKWENASSLILLHYVDEWLPTQDEY